MGRHRSCLFCSRKYVPHPRLGERQKTCGNPDCKKKQNQLCQKLWKSQNRDACRENQKNWSQASPGYWQTYRANHPVYTERNRRQTALRKQMLGLGLQRKLDILEVSITTCDLWNLRRFAKETRSLTPLFYAYAFRHESITCSAQSVPP